MHRMHTQQAKNLSVSVRRPHFHNPSSQNTCEIGGCELHVDKHVVHVACVRNLSCCQMLSEPGYSCSFSTFKFTVEPRSTGPNVQAQCPSVCVTRHDRGNLGAECQHIKRQGMWEAASLLCSASTVCAQYCEKGANSTTLRSLLGRRFLP
jgi:hypothetical protein